MNANNLVSFTGNVTRDPEIKDAGGSKVAKFSLAVNRFYKKNGENMNQASFFDCEAWGNQVEVIESYVKKGSKVSVVGEAIQDTWEKDGEKRSKIFFRVDNLQLRDSKKSSEDNSVEVPNKESVPF